MSDLVKSSLNLFSLTTNTFGISCERNDNMIKIEINLNTIIYLAAFSCLALVVIFCYNLIKEKFVRLKSSANSLD